MQWQLAAVLLSSLYIARIAAAQMPASTQNFTEKRVDSRAVDAGNYVYISGQGPRRTDGTMPDNFEAQVQQALGNVRTAIESSGLTMEHVVYTQVYLEDIGKYDELNGVFAQYFQKRPPAPGRVGCSSKPRWSDSNQYRRRAEPGWSACRLSAE